MIVSKKRIERAIKEIKIEIKSLRGDCWIFHKTGDLKILGESQARRGAMIKALKILESNLL